jgi:hypothetical protein
VLAAWRVLGDRPLEVHRGNTTPLINTDHLSMFDCRRATTLLTEIAFLGCGGPGTSDARAAPSTPPDSLGAASWGPFGFPSRWESYRQVPVLADHFEKLLPGETQGGCRRSAGRLLSAVREAAAGPSPWAR